MPLQLQGRAMVIRLDDWMRGWDSSRLMLGLWLGLFGWLPGSQGQPFQLPTANRAVLERGGEARFFAPTVGKTWPSGTFGCVRTDGRQLHEGIDILRLQVDRAGEPTDPVMAVADGVVAYVNHRPGLSNYGLYIVVRHNVDGLVIYSLYAHLRSIGQGVAVGVPVKSGQVIAILGRTTNTRSPIGKDRAHLHLEFDFQLNPNYAQWHARYQAGERNDHGNWNGKNLVGLDPWQLYMAQAREGRQFNLLRWIRSQPELFRVFVRDTDFFWLRQYPGLVRQNPRTAKEGVAGYEIAFNYVGVPFELTPRSSLEVKGQDRIQLLSVNAGEYSEHMCRKLVVKRGARWELTTGGVNLVNLLLFTPP